MLAAIELVESKDGPVLFDKVGHAGGLCRDHALSHGLMMRAVRDGMILSPPLTYTRDDIDATVAIARTALDATAGDLESHSKVIANRAWRVRLARWGSA